MQGPLAGTRVIDLSDYVAGPYCTRLLAGFGADVIKVEPPAGDPIRRWTPPAEGERTSAEGDANTEAGPLHLYLNQGKRSVVLDFEPAEGRDALWRLIDTADVLVESGRPGTMARWGVDADAVARRKPDLLYVSISDFGQDGPYSGYRAWDITTYALSGLMSITGEPHREPLKNGGYLGQYVTGHKAFDAVLVGLWERARSGLGQHLDISVFECVASLLEHYDMQWIYAHLIPTRAGNGSRAAWGLYPAADGWVGVVSGPARRWANIGVLMESEELRGERYLAPGAQLDLRDEIDAHMLPWLVTHNKEDIYHRAQALGLPFGYAATPPDLFEVEQLQYRGFFERIDHPVAGPARYPTIAAHFDDGTGDPLWSLGRAPLLGEHTAEVLSALEAPAHAEPSAPVRPEPAPDRARVIDEQTADPYARKGPLDDIVILDCSMVWAGPYATKLLGDMGATIVKVEAARHMDSVRGQARPVPGVGAYPDNDPGAEPWNRAGYYNKLNRNKLSLCIDILEPAGREVFLELAAKADVVLENFGGGVFTRMGYSLEALQAVNPDIVLVSMPPSGNGGPEGKYVGYGVAIEQLGGIVAGTGYAGDIPMKTGINYGDPIAGIHAAGYIMTALLHRRRTGRGAFVDMSQREAAVMWIGHEIVEYELTGSIPERIGNRDEFMAPSGVYRCAPDAYGDDAWLALAVGSLEEWRALATAIDCVALASDPTYATVEGRRARHDEIDALITAWTSQRTPDEAMALLQAAGVAAATVANMRRVVEDPHLGARGFWPEVDQPSVGRHVIAGLSWHFSRTPGAVRWAAPNLGQHTDYILRTILGKTDAEIEALRATGVLSNTPLEVA